MRALLDTHVWLWLLAEPGRLRPRSRRALESADDLVLSAVSVWEVVVKEALGKIELPVPVADLVALTREEVGARVLAVDASHALGLQQLPPLHRDPFDRMILSQARVERLKLVSADAAMAAYDVDVLDPT